MAFRQAEILLWIACVAILVTSSASMMDGIGVNWGTQLSHPLDPNIVVSLLKANGIKKVKLFDSDPWTMTALMGTDIEVMVAIPNDQLQRMSSDYGNAKAWVKENVTAYDHQGGVNIKYVAVGNEPFLTSYNGSFMKSTFPALKNIQKALNEAGAGNRIKATVPLNADVYGSPDNNPVPSAGDWRHDIHDLMTDIVKFLHSNKAPFVVNIYPYLSLHQNPDFPVDFAFFDGGSAPISDKNIQYTNVFDANYDTLVWSLKKTGLGDMKIIVGEVGWPTDGYKSANLKFAERFYNGFFKKMAKKKGTPMRPGKMDVYLFGLIDEDEKSILPGFFERHWGLFTYDGKPKFPMDSTGQGHEKYLVGAKGVEYLPAQWCVFNEAAKPTSRQLGSQVDYACSLGDCTPLVYGASCNNLDRNGNISYAFNSYYQMQDQDVRACDFGGLAKVTTKNASRDGCLFPVQIVSDGGRASVRMALLIGLVAGALMMVM